MWRGLKSEDVRTYHEGITELISKVTDLISSSDFTQICKLRYVEGKANGWDV